MSDRAISHTSANQAKEENVDADAVLDGSLPGAVVDQAELADLDAAYVEPPEYARAEAVLRAEHVLVLAGPLRTGRTTTALRLLQHAASGEVHRVARLDEVPERLPPLSGWLLDEPGPEDLARLDLATVREYAAALREVAAFLVVVVGDRSALPPGPDRLVVRTTGEPDPEAVLEQGLRQEWTGGLLPRRVARVVQQDWVQTFLDARPLPGDVHVLVRALVAVGRGELDAGAAEARVGAELADRLAEWFERHPDPRDRCLLLAAAVLHGSGADRVDDAARLLEQELGLAEDRAWRAANPRERRLRVIGAHLADGEQATPWGGVPTRVVRFCHPSLAAAVLRHVWADHDDVRRPLAAWLERLALAGDGDPATARRAAAVLGELGRDDLGWLLDRAVRPWAALGGPGAREAAAVALATVAAHPPRADAVLRLLRTVVAEDPGSRMAAVAAATYGLVAEPAWAAAAREDLLAVLAADPAQVPAVVRGLARLCEGPAAGKTLDALLAAASGPTAVRALDVALRVARYHRGEGGVPLLLALAEADPRQLERVVALWRAAWTRPAAPSVLRGWLQASQERGNGTEALDAVLDGLGRGSSRPTLLAALATWAAEPTGPRTAAAAAHRRLRGGVRRRMEQFRKA